MKKIPGKKDFTTAPNISRLFRDDCNLILSFWQNLGSPKTLI